MGPAHHGPHPAGAVLPELGGAKQGLAYGRHCYRGPKPPLNAVHTYVYTVYVLDTILDLKQNSRRKDFFAASEGHILQKATCSGKCRRGRQD